MKVGEHKCLAQEKCTSSILEIVFSVPFPSLGLGRTVVWVTPMQAREGSNSVTPTGVGQWELSWQVKSPAETGQGVLMGKQGIPQLCWGVWKKGPKCHRREINGNVLGMPWLSFFLSGDCVF